MAAVAADRGLDTTDAPRTGRGPAAGSKGFEHTTGRPPVGRRARARRARRAYGTAMLGAVPGGTAPSGRVHRFLLPNERVGRRGTRRLAFRGRGERYEPPGGRPRRQPA